MILLDTAQLAATPWKNGGGFTRELACHPAGASLEDFVWRLSIADVAQSGPFSRFPGVDRVITLLDGAGMSLSFEDGRRVLLEQPHAPFHFRGEDAVQAELIATPSRDLNLMLRRELVEGDVAFMNQQHDFPAVDASLAVLITQGSWTVASLDQPAHTLQAGQAALWIDAHDALRLTPTAPGSTLLCIRIAARKETDHGRP